MATSGQTSAQIAQPVHCPLSIKLALGYPAAFSLSESLITPLGQKVMHSSQPLQPSLAMTILPFICLVVPCLSVITSKKQAGPHGPGDDVPEYFTHYPFLYQILLPLRSITSIYKPCRSKSKSLFYIFQYLLESRRLHIEVTCKRKVHNQYGE